MVSTPFSSRVPLPPPPNNPHLDGSGGGMNRVPLPPDRVKKRLIIALCVSVLVNVAFYNQAAIWGKQVQGLFLRVLHQQNALPPAQIILVAPRPPVQPGGKTTFAPLAAPTHTAPSPSPFPLRGR